MIESQTVSQDQGQQPGAELEAGTYSYDKRFYHYLREGATSSARFIVSLVPRNGITSFTEAPLRLITLLGWAVSLLSFGMAFWALYVRLTNCCYNYAVAHTRAPK